MGKEQNAFEVKEGRFWIVEIREGKKSQAWVYDSEDGAIDELLGHIQVEKLDPDKLDPEEFSQKYNVQLVEIAEDKYNMKGVSLLKIFMRGMMQKK